MLMQGIITGNLMVKKVFLMLSLIHIQMCIRDRATAAGLDTSVDPSNAKSASSQSKNDASKADSSKGESGAASAVSYTHLIMVVYIWN